MHNKGTRRGAAARTRTWGRPAGAGVSQPGPTDPTTGPNVDSTPRWGIRLACLVPLALGLTLASPASSEAQGKRLSMNVKVGANAFHTPAFAQTRLGQNEIQFQGRVSMPPQRQFKVGGPCRFSRGGIPLQRTLSAPLRLPVTGAGESDGAGRLIAEVEGQGASGASGASTHLLRNFPRKANLELSGSAASLMTQGDDRPEGIGTASYQASLGSRGIDVRQPRGRQVLVEVVNRRPRPAFLRLEGQASGGISEFRFATNASAQIEYMRLRCGTPYRGGKPNVLVRGGAPAPDGEFFNRRGNRQLRIGRGRHQVWLAAGIIGSAVGVNAPDSDVFHDSQSVSRAELDVCLLGRRGGRC